MRDRVALEEVAGCLRESNVSYRWMLPAGRVSHSPAIAEAGLRPRAAITNVGPSLRGPGRALTPGGDASNRSDPMLNRFDPHLWRTMPTEYGLVLPRAPASLEPSTGGSPFAEGASGLGAHGLIRWAWMPSSRLWGMDHPRPLVQRGGDQAGAPAPDQTLNAKPRHGAPSAESVRQGEASTSQPS